MAHRGPNREFIRALDKAGKADIPDLPRTGGKPEAAERNGLQHNVTIRRDTTLRIPERFPARIVANAVRGASVVLNPVRIHIEPVSVFVVLEGIDIDGDAVIRIDLLSRGHTRANLARIVLADPRNV